MPEETTKERPGYEQARDQLADLVKRLEAGGLTLEQSLELWGTWRAAGDDLRGVARGGQGQAGGSDEPAGREP